MTTPVLVFTLVFFILTAIYLFWFAGFFIGQFNLKAGVNKKPHQVSIVVPARNEAATIRACLDSIVRQDYPADRYEIIVVDDHSTDGTPGIVEHLVPEIGNLRLVRSQEGRQGKKQAITQGIEPARGDIIAIIDADCIAQPAWLAGLMRYFTPDVGVVAGATFFKPEDERSFLHKLQALDGLALIAAGAGSMGAGHPTICNGSNLAYRRKAFDQVGGFAGIEKVGSGDDDMFVQKVHKLTAWKVVFAADPGTFNWTRPVDGLGALIRQRTRWCSTCASYPDRVLSAFLIMTYFYYWLALAAAGLFIWQPGAHLFLLFLLISKELVQILVLVKGTTLFKRKDLLLLLPVLVAVHMPYVLLVSTLGLFTKTRWKGR